MLFLPRALLVAVLLLSMPVSSNAQGAQVAFGGLKQDTSLPVEITSDQLQVNQADGTAVFTGNVVIGQGEMRLTADRVRVEYTTENRDSTGRISRLLANGNVLLVNGAEAAEADAAVYTIDDGMVVMTGNVLLTQGQNALSSERMDIDLKTGTAIMKGRVKSILKTGSN